MPVAVGNLSLGGRGLQRTHVASWTCNRARRPTKGPLRTRGELRAMHRAKRRFLCCTATIAVERKNFGEESPRAESNC